MEQFLRLLPKLGKHLRKGDCGRIGVIGGSIEYTGAPYFAASSICKLGADLIYVFCSNEAAPIIKTYSPDLIVHPGLKPEDVLPKLSRLDAIILGPGLGRNLSLNPLIDQLFNLINQKNIPFVIDGDGLWFVAENVEKFPKNMSSTILTPNFVEFSRLCKAVLDEDNVINCREIKKLEELGIELSRRLNVAIYMKGEIDLIITSDGKVSKCEFEASFRRCGGQGDLTAGTLGLLLFWAKKNSDSFQKSFHEAGIASSWLVRTAGKQAFEKHGRSMNTPLMLEEIPKIIKEIEK
ncbi:unnamed protein product [Caenorhabditis angaria]|uniref:ATP-dependent (S)-NAD(P)H-hydrate dehydratase n=1 Tax=Caenorhabditis angaria TaxID=860376 RepID=A0A9P1N2L9_9PELO|nr:unnamed protein product [Caenorhabditis angaria]